MFLYNFERHNFIKRLKFFMCSMRTDRVTALSRVWRDNQERLHSSGAKLSREGGQLVVSEENGAVLNKKN